MITNGNTAETNAEYLENEQCTFAAEPGQTSFVLPGAVKAILQADEDVEFEPIEQVNKEYFNISKKASSF